MTSQQSKANSKVQISSLFMQWNESW